MSLTYFQRTKAIHLSTYFNRTLSLEIRNINPIILHNYTSIDARPLEAEQACANAITNDMNPLIEYNNNVLYVPNSTTPYDILKYTNSLDLVKIYEVKTSGQSQPLINFSYNEMCIACLFSNIYRVIEVRFSNSGIPSVYTWEPKPNILTLLQQNGSDIRERDMNNVALMYLSAFNI